MSTANVRIETAPGKGNGLFATRDLGVAEEILVDTEPSVAIPDDAHLRETCSWCLSWKPSGSGSSGEMWYSDAGKPLLQCTICKTVKYCDQKCQRADWKHHKHECPLYTRLHPRILPATVRATLRILLTTTTPPTFTPPLQSHLPAFASSPKWESICLMSKGAHSYSNTALPESAVLEIYCKILVNTHKLATPTLDPIGLYLSPHLAQANHSCAPNCTIIFAGRVASLRSIAPIKTGDELTITYIDTTNPSYLRQAELKERYFFDCRCARCREPADDSYVCECGGTVRDDAEALVCGRCDKTTHRRQVLRELETTAFEAAENGTLDDVVASLKAVYATGAYPATRQPLPALHAAAVQQLLEKREYAEALRHQVLLYTTVDPVLYPPTHPVRVVRGWVLVCLMVEVMRSGDEVEWGRAVAGVLREVETAVKGSHGEESGFAKVVAAKGEEVREEMRRCGVEGGGGEGLVRVAGEVVGTLRRELGAK